MSIKQVVFYGGQEQELWILIDLGLSPSPLLLSDFGVRFLILPSLDFVISEMG